MKTQIVSMFIVASTCLFSTACMADISAAQEQQKFWDLIETQDASLFIATIEKDIRKEIDEPVAAVWLKSISKRLGKVKKIEVTRTNILKKLTSRKSFSEAIVHCEKGTASSKLTMQDDQILAFTVRSKQMENWFQGVEDITSYRAMSQRFIAQFLSGQLDESYMMLHADLRKDVKKETIRKIMERLRKNGGALKKSTFRNSNYDAKEERLSLFFNIECENAKGEAEIQIQFRAMTGDILGFYFR